MIFINVFVGLEEVLKGVNEEKKNDMTDPQGELKKDVRFKNGLLKDQVETIYASTCM